MGGVATASIPLWRRLLAEFLGSAFLAAVVIGAGIAAQRLSPGQVGLELLEDAAATAPVTQPATWAGRYAAAARQEIPPSAASANDTTGLKWPPDTGPNIKMIANSPAAVAAEFSSSCRPVSPGDSCWAAIPEPITIAARNALPRNSAASRRRRSGALFTPHLDGPKVVQSRLSQ